MGIPVLILSRVNNGLARLMILWYEAGDWIWPEDEA